MTELGEAIIIHGDAGNLEQVEDESIDLIVTSPPFFGQRSYQDGGEHYLGQVGAEATPQEFIDTLIRYTEHWATKLKRKGSMMVNLGDKMAGSGAPGTTTKLAHTTQTVRAGGMTKYNQETIGGARPKSLMGLPWRYALGCIDQLELILRAEIIWSKPNGMPESVDDRVRRSHEQWFHLVRQGDYFTAVDHIRQPHVRRDGPRPMGSGNRTQRHEAATDNTGWKDHDVEHHPLGKLPNSVWWDDPAVTDADVWDLPPELAAALRWDSDSATVWNVATEQLIIPERLKEALGLVDHYAAFPSEWPRRFILGWCPKGICLECGEGRFPVVAKTSEPDHPGRRSGSSKDRAMLAMTGQDGRQGDRRRTIAAITGYACACTPFTLHPGTGKPSPTAGPNGKQGERPVAGIGTTHERVGPWREYHLDGWDPPPTRRAKVLDPFGGTGTTAMVARSLGHVGISNDLSADYCRLAEWRIFRSGHAAKALMRTWSERQGTLL